MVLFPRETGELIARNAKHVSINQKGIETLGCKIVKHIQCGKVTKSEFSNIPLHPKPWDLWAIDWMFVVDTLNFCFWSPPHEDNAVQRNNGVVAEVRWKVNDEVGYFGLCAAINRALKENREILSPEYYSQISLQDLAAIFRSDDENVEIPLLEERVKCLHEVGEILLKKFNGTFKTCLELANGSAITLLKLIVENFPCFRDEAVYDGVPVGFYKRAQILVADIWSCFHKFEIQSCQNANVETVKELIKLANFHDIQKITMFADYRVPQVLNFYGVLEYSEELLNVLKTENILTNGCEFELEIRGCSIQAIELLRNWIEKNYENSDSDINSVLLDQYLWELRRNCEKEMRKVPFHRVISIYY